MGRAGREQVTKGQVMAWRMGQHVDRASEWDEQLQEMLGAGGQGRHGDNEGTRIASEGKSTGGPGLSVWLGMAELHGRQL